MKCQHGAEIVGRVDDGHIDAETLNDPNDEGIMAFYVACDCCGYPMHVSSPYQYIPETGETLCFTCQNPNFYSPDPA